MWYWYVPYPPSYMSPAKEQLLIATVSTLPDLVAVITLLFHTEPFPPLLALLTLPTEFSKSHQAVETNSGVFPTFT